MSTDIREVPTTIAAPDGPLTRRLGADEAACIHCAGPIARITVPGEDVWFHTDGMAAGYPECGGESAFDARYPLAEPDTFVLHFWHGETSGYQWRLRRASGPTVLTGSGPTQPYTYDSAVKAVGLVHRTDIVIDEIEHRVAVANWLGTPAKSPAAWLVQLTGGSR